MAFTPLFPTGPPRRPGNRGTKFLNQIIRDQLPLTTWLLLGASLQGLLVLLPIRPTYAVLPAFLILAFKVVDTLLVTLGWKQNPYMQGVIRDKFSAMVPNKDGTFGPGESANEDEQRIAVLLLGFRINHPLGLLSPGARKMSSHFQRVITDLHRNSASNGYIGSTGSLTDPGANRSSKSVIMTTLYFKSMQHLQDWAHGPAHREGWNWWYRDLEKMRYLGIMHEAYEAPRGHFEVAYMGMPPTMLGATRWEIGVGGEKGEKKESVEWRSPIVAAGRGKLATAKGRYAAYE